jgi:hypothetical protein
VGAGGEQAHGLLDLRERERNRLVDELARTLPHPGQQRAAAGAVHPRRLELDLPRLSGRERRGQRGPGLRLGGHDAYLRPQRLDDARDPRRQSTTAPRDDDRVELRCVLHDLETDRAVPRHHRFVARRVDEEPVHAVATVVDHGLPPLLVRDRHKLRPERLDPVELRARCTVGDDHARRHTGLARSPGDALRHVPGARRDDARLQFRGRCRPDRGQCAAELEAADRLEALQL